MGREVGFLTGSHDIPSTYERLPVFLTGAYDLDGWTRLPGFLESRYDLPAGSLYERGKFHSRYQLESAKRFAGALTSSHALPSILKRKGFIGGAYALNGGGAKYGYFGSRFSLGWGWAKETLHFQGNHVLRAREPFSGILESRYSTPNHHYLFLGFCLHNGVLQLPSRLWIIGA